MLNTLWTLPIDSAPRGLCVAREAERLLVWTDADWLFWTNRKGERQAQTHLSNHIAAAAVSDDGSAFAVAETDGRISWMGPDLRPRWDRHLPGKPTALAVDPLGLVAAVATNQSQIHFLYSDGEVAREAACPRAAHYLAFVPGTTTLIAAADLGWVGAFDLEIGDWIWRDAPVVSIGGLAVAGVGEPAVLACFSEGIRAYKKSGKVWTLGDSATLARIVAMSYDARLLVALQTDGAIAGQTIDCKPRFSYRPGAQVVAMALSSLGNRLWLAQADRKIVALSIAD